MTRDNREAIQDIVSNYFIPTSDEDFKAFSDFVIYDDMEKEVYFKSDDFTVAVLSDEVYKDYPSGFDFFKDITFKRAAFNEEFDIIISEKSFKKILEYSQKETKKDDESFEDSDLYEFANYLFMNTGELCDEAISIVTDRNKTKKDKLLLMFAMEVRTKFDNKGNLTIKEPVKIVQEDYLDSLFKLP